MVLLDHPRDGADPLGTHRAYGRFSLSTDADERSIEATCKDGGLTLRVDKAPRKPSKARQIEIG